MTRDVLSHWFEKIWIVDFIDCKDAWDDLNQQLQKRSIRKRAQCQGIQMDLRHIKFPRKQFDLIFGNWAICYLSDADVPKFLAKVHYHISRFEVKGLLILKETTRS